MTSITIENITKCFGQVRAVDDVSLHIAAGELFFLLGPSGCGKTTLLRTVAGFTHADSGRILFGDKDVALLAPRHRNTAMVFQSYALWPHMTVAQNVAFGLVTRKIPRNVRKARVHTALEMVKMGEFARRKPNQLSGGQQQRVALARALVVRPQCLLLDEPLSNLDAKLRSEMRVEIRDLAKESGLTAVYVTHDQKEALSIADRIAVLYEGRVAQVGTPREVYHKPRTAAIADFLGETNFLSGKCLKLENGLAAFSTPVGLLHADATADAPGSGECTLSIRPESIKIVPAVNGNNCFQASVVRHTFLGDSVQLTLRANGVMLHILIPEQAGSEPLTRDTNVICQVAPGDIVVVPPQRDTR
ncbi:MAG: ABC transporter ATP-binding protein [Phycisphaerae bacterium]